MDYKTAPENTPEEENEQNTTKDINNSKLSRLGEFYQSSLVKIITIVTALIGFALSVFITDYFVIKSTINEIKSYNKERTAQTERDIRYLIDKNYRQDIEIDANEQNFIGHLQQTIEVLNNKLDNKK